MYLVNDTTAEVGIFNNPQPGWSEATQEQIDEYLLARAKDDKNDELSGDLDTFVNAGYEYAGAIVCDAWNSETTYNDQALVLASDAKNYHSLANSNTNHEPPNAEWWEEYKPDFKPNSGTLLNITAKCALDAGVTDRYKFYTARDDCGFRHQINFNDPDNWNAFAEAMRVEEDRVMRKYCDYQSQIAACANVAEVEAVSIDFSA
jgi:hypothetical protein